jgi:DNA-binding response OmpR family regulator
MNILVIDDDLDILTVLKANLELHGFSVRTAQSLERGAQLLAAAAPDLMILDRMLPDGDGLAWCRDLRTRNTTIPLIMLTAKDKVADRIMGLEGGADDYVIKPFDTQELIARIRALLRRFRKDADACISAGDLTVDRKKRLVRLCGQEITLTPKEYELLTCLMLHRGEVVQREDLRRLLWKENKIYSWSRVIDVHIQHLRQKIEPTPSEPCYIITVPGVGYRFRE